MTVIDKGLVEKDAAGAAAPYTLTTPSTALAGDVVLATLEAAVVTFSVSSAPPNSRLLVSGAANPGGAHYHGGVWAVPVTGPNQTMTWTWSGAVRGSLAWVLIRGTTVEALVVGVSAWVSGTGAFVAPNILAPANSEIFVGASQGSGSSFATFVTPWSLVVDAAQRNGIIGTRGVQVAAGNTGTYSVPLSDGATARVWHVAAPTSVPPSNVVEKVTIQGVPTQTTHIQSVWATGATRARLLAKNSSGGTPIATGAWVNLVDNWAKISVTGLIADTGYFFQPEYDTGTEQVLGVTRGPIYTPPVALTPSSFSIAIGGDNHTTEGQMIAHSNLAAHSSGVRYMVSNGDTHDADNTATTQASHRQDWEQLFTDYTGLAMTVGNIPFLQNFGDHDGGGGNNAAPGAWTAPNIAAYTQVIPHPPSTMLPNNTGWAVGHGRVRMIGLDVIHQRTSTYKVSPAQMTWLEAELNKDEPFKIIFVGSVWYDEDTPEGWPNGDGWNDYNANRTAIVDLINASKVAGKTLEVLAVHGDQEALSAMSGEGNDYGGFPVIGGSPLSGYASHKGAVVPDSGRYPAVADSQVIHQHGIINVDDNGDNGMIVQYRGYDDSNTVRVQLDIWIGEATGPGEVSGASTGLLTAPEGRWVKAPMRPVWLDTSAGKWRGVIPTSTGHRLFDFSSSAAAVQGVVVDTRQDARVTAFHKSGTTYILRQHYSGSLLNVYGENFTVVQQDVSVPLSATNHDASPVALIRTSNGHLWAANITDGAIRITRSTNGGSSWTPAYVTALWGTGITGVVGLWETEGNLILIGTANDGPGRIARRIPIVATDITTGWVMETLPLLPSPTTSDDHLSGDILPDGRLILAAKTTASVSASTPLLYTLIRELGGNWVMKTFEVGPDEVGYTRPRVVVTLDTVHVYYGSIELPQSLYRRSAPLASPTTFGARELLLTGPNWWDSVVTPSAADIALDRVQYPVFAANADTGRITLMWHEAGEPPPVDDSGFTVRVRRGGQTVTVTMLTIKGYPPILRGAVRRGNVTVPFV